MEKENIIVTDKEYVSIKELFCFFVIGIMFAGIIFLISVYPKIVIYQDATNSRARELGLRIEKIDSYNNIYTSNLASGKERQILNYLIALDGRCGLICGSDTYSIKREGENKYALQLNGDIVLRNYTLPPDYSQKFPCAGMSIDDIGKTALGPIYTIIQFVDKTGKTTGYGYGWKNGHNVYAKVYTSNGKVTRFEIDLNLAPESVRKKYENKYSDKGWKNFFPIEGMSEENVQSTALGKASRIENKGKGMKHSSIVYYWYVNEEKIASAHACDGKVISVSITNSAIRMFPKAAENSGYKRQTTPNYSYNPPKNSNNNLDWDDVYLNPDEYDDYEDALDNAW